MNMPFFIIGTQRSGTTLLRLILNAHSQIAIPGEAEFLMPLLNQKTASHGCDDTTLRTFTEYLRKNDIAGRWHYDPSGLFETLSRHERLSLRELLIEIHISFAKAQNKPSWGNKTPSFFRKVDILQEIFPEAKFIHIVRDGRDAFDSWRRLDPSRNNAALEAMEWRYKIRRIEESFGHLPSGNRLTIRYEDLLVAPEDTLRSVCSFLELEFEPEMLNFYESSHRYVGGFHSQLIFKPLDKNNIQKWKVNLNEEEAAMFDLIAGRTLEALGYERDRRTFGAMMCLQLILRLAYGLPLRAFRVVKIKLRLASSVRRGEKGPFGRM